MQLTSFHPQIISNNAESVIELFGQLGFTQQHMKVGINDRPTSNTTMKDEGGFYVDVVQSDKVKQDMTSIRMNVDDFDAAYDLLISRGFKNAQGDKITDTGSSKSTMMVSPSGFAISLVKHVK